MSLAVLLAAIALFIGPPAPTSRLGAGNGGSAHLRIRAGPWARFRSTDTGDPVELAGDIDVFAACLDAGLGTRDSAEVVARMTGDPHRGAWMSAVALLGVGVPAERAFTAMEGRGGLEELASLATVSARSGSAFSAGCVRIADTLRADAADHRTAAAERAGVLIALPLATCFLPAFMILGLAPVILGLGSDLLANL
ncbi:type II secretion system F family protein [Corynebacterium pacaense]|uniref:type II secretion system F family protein n=1 Tax=Corynebacterium pacaense TaxID=1816684 RepID=UPI0009BB0E00|nr:type II secretion system F family protein [Corynebacterium pacaense]